MLFTDFLIHVKETLKENFDEIDTWFSKPESVRLYKPNNGGWTINEILEHISLTNHFLLILINKGAEKASKTNSANELDINTFRYDLENLKKLEEVGIHQSFQWIRPEHMEPKGDMNLEVVRNKLKEQVKKCLDALELLKDGKGLSIKTTMSVNHLGKIDVYQYIHFLSLHGRRHIEQMKKNQYEYDNKQPI